MCVMCEMCNEMPWYALGEMWYVLSEKWSGLACDGRDLARYEVTEGCSVMCEMCNEMRWIGVVWARSDVSWARSDAI